MATDPAAPATGNGFTVKEIVIEIRDAVKELAVKVDDIDRKGSIGTKSELDNHDRRLLDAEREIVLLHSANEARATADLVLAKETERRRRELDAAEAHSSRISARALAWAALAVAFSSALATLIWLAAV